MIEKPAPVPATRSFSAEELEFFESVERELLDPLVERVAELAGVDPNQVATITRLEPPREAYGPYVPVPSRPRTILTASRIARIRESKRARPAEAAEPITEPRPRTRADCVDGPRPCPWVSCKWHLAYDFDRRTGSIKQSFPGLELEQLRYTCALDVAELGGITLEQTGEVMNLTRERVRQMVEEAAAKMAGAGLEAPDGPAGFTYPDVPRYTRSE